MLESNTPTKTHNNKDLTKLLPLQGMSRAKDILPLLPFSRTTLHEWSNNGRFPASIKLSSNIVAWRNIDVINWLEKYKSSLSSNENMESENEI
ncbi:helix-turn-helix transcriptional regulator [Psychrobacter cibarius]|jgi:predicted DNA-binding transcriptional regulator AlpA|uniref:helix-turn-helix transcriptional regulator n=1 Tax=Psychrobacter cibarius TaxID=282669 RepID=UPI0018DEF326|nr:AlpA family phage regulatory protein [Psychrobacter cibarius]